MDKLSDTYKELGIAFSFPIKIEDANGNETYFENSKGFWNKREYDSEGNETYFENSDGYWWKYEYDANDKRTYYEDSDGFWSKREYDANGNKTYFENSVGYKEGAPAHETPLERYTKQHCKIAGIVYMTGGTIGLIGLIVAEIFK